MTLTYREQIVLTPDGTAAFTKRMVIEGAGDTQEKVVEDVAVDIRAVLDASIVPTLGPIGCRAVAQRNDTTVYVVEHAPMTRRITWRLTYPYTDVGKDEFFGSNTVTQRLRDRRAHRDHPDWFARLESRFARMRLDQCDVFQLALPYVVLCYRFVRGAFDHCYCFYRTAPIGTLDDALAIANLPNVQRSGRVCFNGSTHYTIPFPAETPMVEQVATVEQQLWAGMGNHVWTAYGLQRYVERMLEVATPWEWEYTTMVEPLFPVRMTWVLAKFSVRRAMDLLLLGPTPRELCTSEGSGTSYGG